MLTTKTTQTTPTLTKGINEVVVLHLDRAFVSIYLVLTCIATSYHRFGWIHP